MILLNVKTPLSRKAAMRSSSSCCLASARPERTVSFGVCRLEPDRLALRFDGLIKLLLCKKNKSSSVVRQGEVGLETNRQSVLLDRSIEIPELQVRHAQHAPRLDVSRPYRDDPLKLLSCLIRFALARQGHAEGEMSLSVVGPKLTG